MTPLGIRIVIAILLLMIFVLVFNAAFTWMHRCDAAKQELEKTKQELKEAREQAQMWHEVLEDLVMTYQERRGA